MGKEAPVSTKYGTGFGWMIVGTNGGTESEVAAMAETTTVGAVSTVAGEATTGGVSTEVGGAVRAIGLSPITSWIYR